MILPESTAEPSGPLLFQDITAESGIEFIYRNGEEADQYAMIETLGGGVALLDYDQDGLLDVFVAGGGYFRNQKVLGYPGKLYRNCGGFKFQDVSKQVGLAGPLQYSHGVLAFDYDNDGWPDLLVSGYNRLILFHNVSDGQKGRKFVNVTKESGLNDTLWSSSVAFGDLNGDGYPDLYVCHYGNWGFEGIGPDGQPYRHPTDCFYFAGIRDVCQPAKFTQLPHTVYQNNRDGTFTDVSQKFVRRLDLKANQWNVGGVRTDGRGIGVLMVDINNDSRPDVYVANDTDENFLYLNRGESYGQRAAIMTEEIGMNAGVARDNRGQANGSMGLAVGDFNRSGLASLLVTNYEKELPALYQNRTRNPDHPQFLFATEDVGLGVLAGDFVSWGTGFVDLDMDGWEDIIIVNGHAIRHPHGASRKRPQPIDRKQKPSLLLNDRTGKYHLESARGGDYFTTLHNARGTAIGDLDNDGRPDLIICHQNDPIVVLRNIAPVEGLHWIGLTLTGTVGRDLVGSRVVIETTSGKQTKFVKGGASYGSTDDPRILLGLGKDDKVLKCTVYWSHGKAEEIQGLTVDSYNSIRESQPRATPTKPKS